MPAMAKFVVEKTFATMAVIGVANASRYIDPEFPGFKRAVNRPEETAEPLLHVEDLPDQWLWNDVSNTKYLTNVFN